MLILFTTPSFLQKFVAVTDSRLPSRFHSLVCFVLWGDSFPVRMCSLNYSMRIAFHIQLTIQPVISCCLIPFLLAVLKTFVKPERKIRRCKRSRFVRFVHLPLCFVGLIYLGVKASITRPCLVVFLSFVQNVMKVVLSF